MQDPLVHATEDPPKTDVGMLTDVFLSCLGLNLQENGACSHCWWFANQKGNHERRQAWETRRQRQPRAAQKGNHEGREVAAAVTSSPEGTCMKGDKLGRHGGSGKAQFYLEAMEAHDSPRGLQTKRPERLYSSRTGEVARRRDANACLKVSQYRETQISTKTTEN